MLAQLVSVSFMLCFIYSVDYLITVYIYHMRLYTLKTLTNNCDRCLLVTFNNLHNNVQHLNLLAVSEIVGKYAVSKRHKQ